MKKSLIALAALAAVGAASAQSSVTLYGIADISAGVVEREGAYKLPGQKEDKANTRETGFNKANLQQSRVGIKGSEDLGNGLKAVFNYEHGFNAANGAFDGGEEARRAVVGLQGGFGSVLLGRDKLPYYRLTEDTSADSISDFSTTNLVGGKRTNGVHYAGNFGGVGVSAAVGYDRHDDLTTGANDTQNTTYGLGLSYATGPFMVGIAGEQIKSESGSLLVTANKETNYGIGGTYDFTAAKVFANYLVSDIDGAAGKDKEANIGVKVPFGAASLVAEVGYNDGHGYDGIDYNVGANYSFSKRTDAYVRAARVDSFDYDAGGDTDTTKYAVGLRHKF